MDLACWSAEELLEELDSRLLNVEGSVKDRLIRLFLRELADFGCPKDLLAPIEDWVGTPVLTFKDLEAWCATTPQLGEATA